MTSCDEVDEQGCTFSGVLLEKECCPTRTSFAIDLDIEESATLSNIVVKIHIVPFETM
jgi:hypothetical protein